LILGKRLFFGIFPSQKFDIIYSKIIKRGFKMFFNRAIFPAVITGIMFFIIGQRVSGVVNGKPVRLLLGLLFILLCVPNFLFVAYYLHFINEPIWYVKFRAINNIELLSSLIGLFFGFVTFKDESFGVFKLKTLNKYIFVICMLLIIIPFIKPIIRPVSRNSEFLDRWKDGVCLQSTGSTCGPAALSTIFNYYGISKKEEEIARASFSSSSGTENWYLIRYAEKNGLKTEVLYKNRLEDVPVPSIIGTYINGRIGHFITILGKEGDRFVVGDSLKGKLLLTEKEFNEHYTFSNFALHIKKPQG